ncbi:alpha/beta fold hydrolase [Pseudomonas aeruginosa]
MSKKDISRFPAVNGFGSATGVPRLPVGFRTIFRSIYVDTGSVGLHAVVGGEGPPLLLVCGWPQNWYAWSSTMLPLSERFTVIAVDPRGIGLSDKPCEGFDADTPSADLFALMDKLGHEAFFLAGHDVGMWIAFAMAVDRPDRVRKVALGEAIIPGVFETPSIVCDDPQTNEFLWHHMFNRVASINERLVEGREELYFGSQLDHKAGPPGAMPRHARDFYIEMLRRVPGALKGSFDYYRGLDQAIPQYRERGKRGIKIPVLAFAGALACGDMIEREMRKIAGNVRSIVFEGCGHYVPEQRPDELVDAFNEFFIS